MLKILCLFLAAAPQTGSWHTRNDFSMLCSESLCSHCHCLCSVGLAVYMCTQLSWMEDTQEVWGLSGTPHTRFSLHLHYTYFSTYPEEYLATPEMLGWLSLVGIFLYYNLCYKIHCWELMNTDWQDFFIQYLDLQGCFKSYWDVWIKGPLSSLQNQEIKAFILTRVHGIFISFE